MKNLILSILLFVSTYGLSQEIEFGFSGGTGFAYIAESLDSNVDMNFNAPVVLAATLTYKPKESNFGIRLTYQNLDARIEGIDWQYGFHSGERFNGSIENRTLLLGLEYIKEIKKINYGYHFSIGQTNERINFDRTGNLNVENSFMVINFGALINYALNEKLALSLEPTFLWNDPINSFSGDYRLGGEDINLLFLFGVKYKL